MSDFRSLHRAGEPLVLPNAWDVASARMLAAAGFPAIGTTSLGVAAANGLPDGQDATGEESLRLVRRIAGLPCHVSVDIERGSVREAVAVAAAGAAGINVEDAMGPVERQVRLIRAVKREVPGLFVNARTDTHWQRGGELREALRRVRAYVDAGADGVFVPGLRAPADIAAVVRAVDVPVNVLHEPCGPTVAELAELGVRRVSTGSLLFRVALAAAVRAARAVRDGAPVDGEGLPTYAEIATGA
ncbi:isocitrate lyase/phosphoenolpyruvate mutase family protein [Dactylosporangium aurantiacum]|uniref:Isocitrate lyase/phosphoenolpyruvate mutase family protein n=1 Tax=Dactylosporangium aurantiacum TaxID=35754 RepID=A0A9Q9ML75_9ACTN|nr:isocitrate lyase/phosphoenolpyruvate mutase family protein [Dactylosporangium aurantiacum]MDG6109176.1 isocitrate lyase/phosphoenolpyruvate mutase family protein [Dactylosporangium aurantiacum]UWZ56576.1 isocitrate lyase/phosphoenolpyruvate mutase family protein [Dactylosporangium aurantiacum]